MSSAETPDGACTIAPYANCSRTLAPRAPRGYFGVLSAGRLVVSVTLVISSMSDRAEGNNAYCVLHLPVSSPGNDTCLKSGRISSAARAFVRVPSLSLQHCRSPICDCCNAGSSFASRARGRGVATLRVQTTTVARSSLPDLFMITSAPNSLVRRLRAPGYLILGTAMVFPLVDWLVPILGA